MKEVVNDIFNSAVTATLNGFPSLYAKDDVLLVINKLRAEIMGLDFFGSNSEEAKAFNIEEVSAAMKRFIEDESDLIDYDSIDMSIGYDNKIEINSVDIHSQQIIDHLEEVMDRIL